MKALWILLFSSSVFAGPINNCTFFTQTDFGATTVSTKALSAMPNRKCLILQNHNKGASIVYVKFDSAHTGIEGFEMGASTVFQPIYIPTNSIYLKSSAGGVSTTILEGL